MDNNYDTLCSATYRRFIVPDTTAAFISETCVVATFASVWTVGVIPNLQSQHTSGLNGKTVQSHWTFSLI